MLVIVLGLTLTVSTFAAPPEATGRVKRLAVFVYPPNPSEETQRNIAIFRQALTSLGWREGENVVVDVKEGRRDRLIDTAMSIVRAGFDVIVTEGTPAAAAARSATQDIPIVMAWSADPVGAGLVASLARPGGNLTGSTVITPEITGKRLEILKDAVPALRRVAAVYPDASATFPTVARWISDNDAAARAAGLTLRRCPVPTRPKWDSVFAATKRDADALTILDGPTFIAEARQIAAAALKHGLPTVFPFREQAAVGGLIAYGADLGDLWRRAAVLVDKVLRGTPPRELPVEQPTRFELVINLKTAKALGLTIPPSLLLRADQVIE